MFIDPNGESFWYTNSGSYLGEVKDKKDEVYSLKKVGEMSITIGDKTFNASVCEAERLEVDGEAITHDTFKGFGGLVYGESSGNKEESYAIANAVSNYVDASNGKYKLSDIATKKNTYSYAVGDNLYNNYIKNDLNKKNARYANGAVINALTGGKDYSNGATHWDGVDLGVNGSSHYRSRVGYTTSQDHINTYKNNTGYTLKSTGANPVYKSTAVQGKSIFWKSHPNNTKNTIYHRYK